MTKIIAGRASLKLAIQICQKLRLSQIEALIEHFQDKELRIQLADNVYAEDVVIVQSTSQPANDHLMELLLLVDAAKRSGARKVIACVPYFGYSRQDKQFYNFEPVSAHLVATMLEAAGVNNLITIDLHSKKIKDFFKINVQNIETTNLFANILKNKPNLIVVSPDIGGIIRSHKLSDKLGVGLAITNKIRKVHNTCKIDEIIGNVLDFHCVIVDDIIDTGDTLCQTTELLIKKGALSVEAIATHAVLSGNAINNLKNSAISKIIVTNTIQQTNLPEKFEVVDVTNLLSNHIRKTELMINI